jgi:hypothetical protein
VFCSVLFCSVLFCSVGSKHVTGAARDSSSDGKKRKRKGKGRVLCWAQETYPRAARLRRRSRLAGHEFWRWWIFITVQ